MADPIPPAARDDAPLASRKHPDLQQYSDLPEMQEGDALVSRSVSINRSPDELYRFWRRFENLSLIMDNVRSVTSGDDGRSHWVVEGPAGKTLEWDAIMVEDSPGEAIEWKSAEGASVRNSGRVEFIASENDRGTVVRVTLAYDPPGGAIGQAVAKLFSREPKVQARRDLRRFKQLMETGEVSTAEPPAAAPRS